MTDRPAVPAALLQRIRDIMASLPSTTEQPAWVGTRWRVGSATVAHVFGGEDQLFRIVFHADPSEVMAFEHLGDPYFRTGWGANVVGLVLGDERGWPGTDWDELTELLIDSYCQQAPQTLAEEVNRRVAGP